MLLEFSFFPVNWLSCYNYYLKMLDIVLVNPPPEQIIEEYDAPEYPHIGLRNYGTIFCGFAAGNENTSPNDQTRQLHKMPYLSMG